MSELILVVDGDPAVAGYLARELDLEGHRVEVLPDVEAALSRAAQQPPSLVLAGGDAVELVRRLRADPATCTVPVLLLMAGAGGSDRAMGLAAGADDVVAKPFDTLELIGRISSMLRRTADSRGASPLTGLPGNHRIEAEIAARAASGHSYAVCHVDLDEFKSFNDAYGFLRGDGLLLLVAGCLRRAASATAGQAPFLGHVGGDDFVVVCAPAQAEPLCLAALAEFDAAVSGCYDAVDAERGWLEASDRRGERRRHPLVSVSVGIACSRDGRDHRMVVVAASEMKSVAKRSPGSGVAIDRRS